MSCINCHAPIRKIYGPYKNRPSNELIQIMTGSWIQLLECPDCKKRWCSVHYEPHGSYEYLILWEYSVEAWKNIYKMDQGESLRTWHKQSIQSLWESLPLEEQKDVQIHQNRSYGHNPIDQEHQKVNIKAFIVLDELKQLFYQFLDNNIDINEVLNHLFIYDEWMNILSQDDYEDLFNIRSNQIDSKYEISRILFKYFSLGEYEARTIINHLNEAYDSPEQLPFKLRLFYSLYCSGYTFLYDLGLVWGFDYAVEVWEQLTVEQRETWYFKHHQKIKECINRALNWFYNHQIIFLDEYNEYKTLKYIDHRSAKEKESLNVEPTFTDKKKNSHLYELIPYQKYKQYSKKLVIHGSISLLTVFTTLLFGVMYVMTLSIKNGQMSIKELLIIFLITLTGGIIFTLLFMLLIVWNETRIVDKAHDLALKDIKGNEHFLITRHKSLNLNGKIITGVLCITDHSIVYKQLKNNNLIKGINPRFSQLVSIEIKEMPLNFFLSLFSGIRRKYHIVIQTERDRYVLRIPAIHIDSKNLEQEIIRYIPHLQNDYKIMRQLINLWDPLQIIVSFPQDEYDYVIHKVLRFIKSYLTTQEKQTEISKLFKNYNREDKSELLLVLYEQLQSDKEIQLSPFILINKLIQFWDPISFYNSSSNNTDYSNCIKMISTYIIRHHHITNDACYQIFKTEFKEQFIFTECTLFCQILNNLLK